MWAQLLLPLTQEVGFIKRTIIIKIIYLFYFFCLKLHYLFIFEGPNARNTGMQIRTDNTCNMIGAGSNDLIAAGETMAFMIVYSFSPNKTRMLERAAWVDSEPAELFHGLTADQLAQIVNWGACQAVLGPDVQVTVTPPPSCSNGLTSDFTVQVTTTRSAHSYSHLPDRY